MSATITSLKHSINALEKLSSQLSEANAVNTIGSVRHFSNTINSYVDGFQHINPLSIASYTIAKVKTKSGQKQFIKEAKEKIAELVTTAQLLIEVKQSNDRLNRETSKDPVFIKVKLQMQAIVDSATKDMTIKAFTAKIEEINAISNNFNLPALKVHIKKRADLPRGVTLEESLKRNTKSRLGAIRSIIRNELRKKSLTESQKKVKTSTAKADK